MIADAPIEVSDGIDGTYSKDTTIWIEPVTGSFVNLSYHMEQQTDDGANFITLDLAYTEDEVADSVADAKSSRDKLNLVRNTVPLIGFIAGIPLLIAGLFLTARGGGGRKPEAAVTQERPKAPAASA